MSIRELRNNVRRDGALYDEQCASATTTAEREQAGGAGPFGALDQCGTVWEWCHDGWDGYAYEARKTPAGGWVHALLVGWSGGYSVLLMEA